MKKAIILGLSLVIMAAVLIGCQKKTEEIPIGSLDGSFANYAEGQELLCLAESQEKAQEIAKMYGIELVSFNEGVATFHTEGDPNEVIKMGVEKGYPPLELNQVMTIY